jgi:hypothetical protein
MSKTAERFLVSVYGGSVITVCVVVVGISIPHFAGPAGGPILARLLAELLFWPAGLLVVGGLDCPNADLISEKLQCIGLCIGVNLVAYSVLTYLVLWLLGKPRRRLDPR